MTTGFVLAGLGEGGSGKVGDVAGAAPALR